MGGVLEKVFNTIKQSIIRQSCSIPSITSVACACVQVSRGSGLHVRGIWKLLNCMENTCAIFVDDCQKFSYEEILILTRKAFLEN